MIQGKSITKVGVRAAQSQQKTREKGVRYSNWFVIINTNYRAKSDADWKWFTGHYSQALDELWDKDRMEKIVYFNGERHADDIWGPETIISVNARSYIEEGTTKMGGRVHSNTIVSVKHRSNIKLHLNAIRKEMNRLMKPYGVKGCYVRIRFIREEMHRILDYARKDQPLSTRELHEAMDELHLF